MLTLETIKQHCRVDDSTDDTLLDQYRQAAIEVLQQQTSRRWYESADEIPEDDPCGLTYNSAVNNAMLLLIGHWYAHREQMGDAARELPGGFWALVQPYRIYGL